MCDKQCTPLAHRIYYLERRPKSLSGAADQRALHRAQIKCDRRNSCGVPGRLRNCTFSCAGRANENQPICLVILHPREHRPGHLGLHAGQVRTGARESLLDLIEEHDHSWWIRACEDRPQKRLSIFAAADILKGLSAPPDLETGSLFDDLPLSLP